ncbi:MAG: hypothetical protein PUC12_17575 [Clostridiales bacterium]|nr:hypothetical protein [Clostridiales bacterium]
MKHKIKRLAGCIIVICLLIGSIHYTGCLLRPTDTDVALNAINTFHNMPENSFEVIAYGSSHVWRGLNVMEMYEKYGISAYNYGCNWQHMNTTRLFFEDSLRTQSPKVIIIETYLVNKLLEDKNMNGEIYYTRGISQFEAKSEYLKQCFGDDKERYLSYYMPLCAFHDNWTALCEQSFSDGYKRAEFNDTRGYLYTEGGSPIEIGDWQAFKQKELSEKALDILDSIVQECNERGIRIIFYTAPYQGEYNYSDAMEQYAEKNGCEYFNLFEKMDEVGIDCNTDFCDKGHLNNNGAVKVADYLGAYIVQNYDVTDIREDKKDESTY